MPITKLCRNCPHIKTLHHITNGRNEGACSVAHCRCTSYGERLEKGMGSIEKSDILDDEIKRAFMDARRAFINLEKKMKERGLELK